MQGKKAMVDIKGVAHFTIPVNNMERSKRFYTDIVGMRHLATLPNGKMAFFDAGGTCIILVKRDAPIHRQEEGSDGVHHAFMVDKDSYRALSITCGRTTSTSSSRKIARAASLMDCALTFAIPTAHASNTSCSPAIPVPTRAKGRRPVARAYATIAAARRLAATSWPNAKALNATNSTPAMKLPADIATIQPMMTALKPPIRLPVPVSTAAHQLRGAYIQHQHLAERAFAVDHREADGQHGSREVWAFGQGGDQKRDGGNAANHDAISAGRWVRSASHPVTTTATTASSQDIEAQPAMTSVGK